MAFMPARSADDLRRKRETYRIWSEMTFGLMGRSPDFMNSTVLALWESRDVFARGGDRFGENVANYSTATPDEGNQIAAMIPDARYVVMNACGHWPQYENADLFNRLHLAFLRGEPLPAEANTQ